MSTSTAPAAQAGFLRGIALSTLTAGLVAAVANTGVSLVAQAAGASDTEFMGLMPAAYTLLGFIGVLAGAIGWSTINRRTENPARILRTLVPAVVLISFIPNLLLLLGGKSVGGVLALCLMHVVVAATAVLTFRRFLPLKAR